MHFSLIAIAATMWGLDSIFITPRYFTLNYYSVLNIIFYIHLIPAIVLIILNYNRLTELYKNYKKNYIIILLSSVIGSVIGTLSIVKALSLSNYKEFSIVALIQQLQPFVALILAIIFLKEKVRKDYYIVFIISLLSVYFMKFGLYNPFKVSTTSIQAFIYSMIAVIAYGSSTVFSKKSTQVVSFKDAVFYRYVVSTIVLLPFVLFITKNREQAIYVLNNKDVLLNLLINSFWGLLALYLYFRGVKQIKASFITIAELFYPISTVLLSIIIYKTAFSIITLISIVSLLLSTIYLQTKIIPKREE